MGTVLVGFQEKGTRGDKRGQEGTKGDKRGQKGTKKGDKMGLAGALFE